MTQPNLFGGNDTPRKQQAPRTPCPPWLAEEIVRLSGGKVSLETALGYSMRQGYAVRDSLQKSKRKRGDA